MSTLSPHERPTPVRPVLVMVGAVTLGAYLLLGGLALADRAHGRWGLALVPLAVVCFALAGWEAYALLRRRS
ncbi:MAG TPA: hypothetical protein VJ986_07250 [Gaiellaceae bacterium]|nr:hypothetical protein [Gaiellaceae bacterium]